MSDTGPRMGRIYDDQAERVKLEAEFAAVIARLSGCVGAHSSRVLPEVPPIAILYTRVGAAEYMIALMPTGVSMPQPAPPLEHG